jgi:hypothetical protein
VFWLASVRSGNIDVLELAKGIERLLVRDADRAAWSPEGRRIAFVRNAPP